MTMDEQREQMQSASGFIAALDQSGGSTPKTLARYGISKDSYSNESEMFDFVHQMRVRIVSNEHFKRPGILGAILFEGTMNRKVENEPTSIYLWDRKHILPFLKIDLGLADESNGVQMMKPITLLSPRLHRAKKLKVFGTKMRSVIKVPRSSGIREVVQQQFEYAERIIDHGLVPIVEPEIDINAEGKSECEEILRDECRSALSRMDGGRQIVFKLTLPERPNFYREFMEHPNVMRVAALSGGYSQEEANRRLRQNDDMIASFSRALTEHLRVSQSDEEFSATLDTAINSIASASLV